MVPRVDAGVKLLDVCFSLNEFRVRKRSISLLGVSVKGCSRITIDTYMANRREQ